MAKRSAGILLYRQRDGVLEVLLGHPGGPFWARKDEGAWSIPKGECAPEEDALATARREFHEETGSPCNGEFLPLGDVKQASGKVVTAWAVEGDLDAASMRSNTFELEYPPKSGLMREFPEVDRGGWFGLEQARVKILPAQAPFLDRLRQILSAR